MQGLGNISHVRTDNPLGQGYFGPGGNNLMETERGLLKEHFVKSDKKNALLVSEDLF